MKAMFYRWLSKLTGRNSANTPVNVILEQMNEPRALPLGDIEFETWSDRIISGACILNADAESLKFALASMIMHLGPQESHKPDIFFIKSLLKSAANQVAQAKLIEIKDRAKARLAVEDAEKVAQEQAIKKEQDALAEATLARIAAMKQTTSAATPTSKEGAPADEKVLAN
jgi:hypothetical protein